MRRVRMELIPPNNPLPLLRPPPRQPFPPFQPHPQRHPPPPHPLPPWQPPPPRHPPPSRQPSQDAPDYNRPEALLDNDGASAVSAISRVLTSSAENLYILDAATKLKHSGTYDIGGTYTYAEPEYDPELWFFHSTTVCPSQVYLLNLFVCHRRPGSFSIGISNSNEFIHKNKGDIPGHMFTTKLNSWHQFRNSQPDECFHIRTFCFSKNDMKCLGNNTLVINIKIEMNSSFAKNSELMKKIKLNHDFGDLFTKQEKTDFVLISESRKKYPVHKIFLAAHSPVLRDLMKAKTGSSEANQAFIDISDSEMELVLQFIYTGTIKEILSIDCMKLIQIADRFQLRNLFLLTQYALDQQIKVENAVEMAIISEKYNLQNLQTNVFSFIKQNPKVLDTDGWKNLDDVNLAKKLFQSMHTWKE